MRFARDHELTDNQTGKVDPDYMAEVEAQTAKRDVAYRRAQRALEAARARHERAERSVAGHSDRRQHAERVKRAWELVEERLRELRVLESLMTEVPASRNHRGSHQPKHRS